MYWKSLHNINIILYPGLNSSWWNLKGSEICYKVKNAKAEYSSYKMACSNTWNFYLHVVVGMSDTAQIKLFLHDEHVPNLTTMMPGIITSANKKVSLIEKRNFQWRSNESSFSEDYLSLSENGTTTTNCYSNLLLLSYHISLFWYLLKLSNDRTFFYDNASKSKKLCRVVLSKSSIQTLEIRR